jgi:O-antigen/teichoic acid export membrane protein
VKTSARSLFHKIFYAVSANLTNMLVSIILSFIVPKLLGVEEYGYWQLYMFYASYVGFFHFGWADGLYLRYGGKYYDELDKSLMHSQYWLLAGMEVIFFIGISLFAVFYVNDANKTLILIVTGLNCILLLPRTILQYLLQSTGRVKEYAGNTILERVLYASLVLFLLFLGYRQFQYMLLADVIAKTFAMVRIAWICRDIVFTKGIKLSLSIGEGWKNISVGIKLLFANIAGMLIIGIVRFSIERTWDITTFGKVSFSLSISNFILVFISAVSIVIFPIIKRSNQDRLPMIYDTLGALLSSVMIVFLVMYYPIKIILSLWLPNYVDAINYFSILFPICLFEAMNSLLINTYLKALRKENAMLWLNGFSVCLSFVLTFITVFWLHNLTLTIVSIVVLLSFRCFISDTYLQKEMKMKYSTEVLWDIVGTIVFIVGNWTIGGSKGWGLYCLFVCCLFLLRRNTFKRYFATFKALVQ